MEPPPGITRRRFVTLSALGVTGFALGACASGGSAPATSPAAPSEETTAGVGSGEVPESSAPPEPTSGAFPQPRVLSSSNGLLEVDLVAGASSIPWEDGGRWAYTYNGSTPGPTLRIRPGDRLVIRLRNELDADTNLHTHGLFVSPSGNSDNIFLSVAPGETQVYEYEIPVGHRSGLFWYHPHRHGTVADQVAAGLAGAIIVEDDLDQLDAMADSTERVWILSDPPIAASEAGLEVGPMERVMGREGPLPLVNGTANPIVEAAAGTRERWRVVNASSSRYYRFAVEGHDLAVLATDGGRLARPMLRDSVLLAPGERVEVMVTPDSAGDFGVMSLGHDRVSGPMGEGGMMGRGMGDGMMSGATGSSEELVLATMRVVGEAPTATLPNELAGSDDLALPAPTASRTLELGMGLGMRARMSGGGMMSFTIDGREFDGFRTDVSSSLGEVEDWTIVNSTGMDHPFHLHVWNFQVIEGSEWSGQPAWKDTVNVPAGGRVTFRVPISGIDGRTVYHCHILDHEDLGMMGVIEVER